MGAGSLEKLGNRKNGCWFFGKAGKSKEWVLVLLKWWKSERMGAGSLGKPGNRKNGRWFFGKDRKVKE